MTFIQSVANRYHPNNTQDHETQADNIKLLRKGTPHSSAFRKRPAEGTFLWRGHGARTLDARSPSSGQNRKDVYSQPDIENVVSSEDSFHLHQIIRIPTTERGVFPTSFSPTAATPNTPETLGMPSKVTHHLRFEIYHSELGEDEKSCSLPGSRNRLNRKGIPLEGNMRRTWVDRKVDLGDCKIPPKAELPIYTPPPKSCPGYTGENQVEIMPLEMGCVCGMEEREVLELIAGYSANEHTQGIVTTPVVRNTDEQRQGYFDMKYRSGMDTTTQRMTELRI